MRKFYTLVLIFLCCFTTFGQIVANDDFYQLPLPFTPVVTSNDTLNGVSTTMSTVNITPITIGQLSIDSNGILTVAPNTLPGTYTITYSICEVANPNNCDTATVTVFIPSSIINAVDDSFVLDPLGGITPSVLNNDTSNGVPVMVSVGVPNSVVATAISVPAWLTFNPDGTITVFPNTPSGTYPVVYQICEALNPINCDTAVATITITNPLDIDMVGTYNDFNNDGFVNVGDVINYQITLTNNGTTTITNLTACQFSMNVNGGTLASLNAGASNSTFFTGVHVITQAEINAGTVFGVICFCGDSGVQNCLDGINTTLNQSNGIKLQAFIDSNSNGIKDASEVFFNGGNFNYSINGGATTNLYSNTGINYLYESNSTTSYNLSYTTPHSGYVCTTTYTNITVPNGSGITTYNFPITIVPYTDVLVNLNPNGAPPRPGFTYNNLIYIKNNGVQTITSGTLTFTKNNVVSIVSIPAGSIANPNGFTLNYSNLLPNETRSYVVTMQVPTIPTVALGQQLTNTAFVTIPANDVAPSNNTASITQTIVGSYDPNDKQETHGGKILHSTFTSNDYLTYTIRFENTGTAEAINIRVNDILDSKLNPNTIKMIAASHPYVLQRTGTELNWKFDGINLLPSVPNTQIGQGYITFQIKPTAGYAIGDIIPNFASIYFDFNPAIVTDVCTTEFVASLSNLNFAFIDLNYYPNPVKNSLSISNASLIEEIEITTLIGQKIITQKINKLQTELNLSNLSNGIYFVKVISEGQEKILKIIKE
ncbi:T9SS type A sorting domain-containing protein [Flavobacterium sp.]|uniref:T9SS type A sorting domain-containing protein n=1 Tax=Flavobacterium sp. TaxID=239 RepID=UPI00261967BB|nr:T9SS type A sorting domain-containing protein [Flavobacterium sp.]